MSSLDAMLTTPSLRPRRDLEAIKARQQAMWRP